MLTVTKPVSYKTNLNFDDCLLKGKSEIQTPGEDGVETMQYKITYIDGKQTAKKLVSDNVTTQPRNELFTVGTRPSANTPCITNATSLGGYTNVNQNAVNNAINNILSPPPVSN